MVVALVVLALLAAVAWVLSSGADQGSGRVVPVAGLRG